MQTAPPIQHDGRLVWRARKLHLPPRLSRGASPSGNLVACEAKGSARHHAAREPAKSACDYEVLPMRHRRTQSEEGRPAWIARDSRSRRAGIPHRARRQTPPDALMSERDPQPSSPPRLPVLRAPHADVSGTYATETGMARRLSIEHCCFPCASQQVLSPPTRTTASRLSASVGTNAWRRAPCDPPPHRMPNQLKMA